MYRSFILSILTIVSFGYGCSPEREDGMQLPDPPGVPEWSVEMVPGDSNRFVLTNLTAGSFQVLWDLPGGLPKTSSKTQDTVLYADKGVYTVTLYVSGANGGGSSSASTTIEVFRDAPMSCTEKMSLLTGGCGTDGKCWTFTQSAGAVKVGPGYEDFSWYTSPPNGLQDEQYNDGFCFTFDNFVFQNKNQGISIDPWNGYSPTAYDPGISDFVFITGGGAEGRDQLLIPDDQFMGVWDSDNLLDIVKLTETELIVRARQCDANGVPLAQGWFELVFMPQ